MSYKTHLQRVSERHDNISEFINSIFPLEGAELAYLKFDASSGRKADNSTWSGDGELRFTIGVKDGANLLDVLNEFSLKAKTSKLRNDLLAIETKSFNVREDEARTNLLRNGVFAGEIYCRFYVHYNAMDCITAARENQTN